MITLSPLGAGGTVADGVRFTREAAEAVADVVPGDPYLFQLVGKDAWDAGCDDEIGLVDVEIADERTYGERLRLVEAASADIPEGEARVLDAIYDLAGDDLAVRGTGVARKLGKAPPQIATAARRLERRAAIQRFRGSWRVEHRLLHRYRTTGDIRPPER